MNKHYLLYLILLNTIFVLSQNNIERDSIAVDTNNLYIEDHNKQLNIKFDITNDQVKYFLPYEGGKAVIKTNLNASLGFVFSYKFLSVRLGIRPSLSDSKKEDKGETDFFRIRLKFLFDKWTHRFEYNYTRGFYIDNTDDFGMYDSDFHIQLPNLTTNIISGSSHYSFNKNYSFKAVESNTEIQLKSAGSFSVGINYNFYDVAGTDKIKGENGNTFYKSNYSEYSGFSTVLNAGYHYTFILHSYWYVNIRANPGFGLDFYETSYHSEESVEKKKDNETFFALSSGISAGYNGKKYYFGAGFNYNVNSEKFNDDNINLQPITYNFNIFIGYRFKAPKQVSKPIDLIEDKVPILQDKN